MRPDRLDLWLGPCVVLLAAVWLWLSYEYIPGPRAAGEPGPRAFPLLLGFVLLALGALVTAAAFRHAEGESVEEEIAAPTRREATFVCATFGLLLLYAFLLEHAGFVAATPVVVLLLLRGVLRVRSWATNALMAGGITLACWLTFAVLLEAPLPRGSWRWLL